MKFYDRTKELEALRKIEQLSATSAQMTVMTGRRRIGKTTLIKTAFTKIPFVYFFVGKKSETLLCAELAEIIRETLGEDLGDFSSPTPGRPSSPISRMSGTRTRGRAT